MNLEKTVLNAIEKRETFEAFKFSLSKCKERISLKLFDSWVDALEIYERRVKYLVDLYESNLLDGVDERTFKLLKKSL